MTIGNEVLDQSKRLAITSMVTGSSSLLFSLAIVVIVFRSHVGGLSTTYHRLLVGMSISDMVSSLPYVLSSFMVDKEMAETVWNARGNPSSCQFQAFTSVFGILVTSGYTCSLCLYFLSVVKFGKSEDYIRRRFEPFFHLVPISLALITAVIGLIRDAYAPAVSHCFIKASSLPRCNNADSMAIDGRQLEWGKEDLVTQRGYYWLFLSQNLIVLPFVMIASMTMIYIEVRKVEKKNEKYGVSSLRLRARTLAKSDVENISRPVNLRNRAVKKSSRSFSKACEKRRAIMQRALAYFLAYLAVHIFPIIFMVKTLSASCVDFSFDLSFIFYPFQGGFNFFVFMSSRVWNAKWSKKHNRTWWDATKYAFTSRGVDPKKKNINTPVSNVHKPKRQAKVVFPEETGYADPLGDNDEEKQEEVSCGIKNLPPSPLSTIYQPHFPTSHLSLEGERSGVSFSSNSTSGTSFSSIRTSKTQSFTSSFQSDGPERTSLSRTSISRTSLSDSSNDNSLRANSSRLFSRNTLSFDRSSLSLTLSTTRVEDFPSRNQLSHDTNYIEQMQIEGKNEELSQLRGAEEATCQPQSKNQFIRALSSIDETAHIPDSKYEETIP